MECLRRALLKIQKEKGKLPPNLYVQSDNGPDMHSKQFIAFCAYLVEKGIFHKVKLSFLVVGHTHEDIDQYFSCISRFIKKMLKSVCSVKEYVKALMKTFTTPGCIPKDIEEVRYCYDTSTIVDSMDSYIARFNLHEKSGDKVHYFLFRKNSAGNTTMQYKLRRYSDALYPRQFQVRDEFVCDTHGVGTVMESVPSKDPFTKEKFWSYTVQFDSPSPESDSLPFSKVYRLPANDCAIPMFPENSEEIATEFELAEFSGTVNESLGDQKAGVQSILKKLNYAELKPDVCENWEEFWASRVDSVHQVEGVEPFLCCPCNRTGPQNLRNKRYLLKLTMVSERLMLLFSLRLKLRVATK